MIIEITSNSPDDYAQKGSQEIGGFNELLKCFWFFLYFTRLIHDKRFETAKIKKDSELNRLNITI